MKLFCLQLDPCIFDIPSGEKERLCSVSDQSVTIDTSFSSGLEDMVNVFVVDPTNFLCKLLYRKNKEKIHQRVVTFKKT